MGSRKPPSNKSYGDCSEPELPNEEDFHDAAPPIIELGDYDKSLKEYGHCIVRYYQASAALSVYGGDTTTE
eukprot:5510654-Prorocentrum_lima.AAC.1